LIATGFSRAEPAPPRRLTAVAHAVHTLDQSRCGAGPGPGQASLPPPLAAGQLAPRAPAGDDLDIPPFLRRFRQR
ncbi:MAG: hypothetical protein HGA45_37780, partial [Chloroflexales bacterium]|nr:hypothetical protein [Chloroflexales bacterium]